MNEQPSYVDSFRRSLDDPESFWLDAAEKIDWYSPPARAQAETGSPSGTWFPGATLNTSVNALDRHVDAGHGDRTALIYDSAMVPAKQSFTYRELLDEVARCAGVLVAQGVVAGDRVVVYMPMIPESVIAMLACARIGAVHSVVFGGFAAEELAKRIDDAEPVALLTASGGLEPSRRIEYLPIVAEALSLSERAPETVIVKRRDGFTAAPEDDWVDWDESVSRVEPAEPVEVRATDPLYILYTSGTTDKPKGVVRDNGGHAVALAWSMRNIYGIGPGEVMWAASDVGWVVGHSYIVYAPLLVGATTVLYEGKPVGTPDAGAFWRVVAEHGVNVLFTAPTALRAIRKNDPDAALARDHDLSSLRALFVAGERLDPSTFEWASTMLDLPVVDHWWQTETGWSISANPWGLQQLPIKAGSSSVPMPGYDVQIVDSSGEPVSPGVEGSIVVGLPLPPGTLSGLWRGDDRFRRSYLEAFPGRYLTGDFGYIDEDGYLFVLGRSGDVINVAGHRLSTGSIEAVVASHAAVAECAVIGIADELKGQRPSAYVVLKSDAVIDPDQLEQDVVHLVRSRIGAVAAFKDLTVVDALPKTRSGKILRKVMRHITAGENYTVPSTIDDAGVLDGLHAVLAPK
ncbi:AMP-binding protein [Rhodococcoides kyotonense]|uniref:Propionyl-CoA synthetase n=1 Tax=Rhodococcoides kyotonense TaxID=398843 RepID=A0A239MZJ6_9NOCA|nr:AMP-binding protein [Rhodococcus kyotonensis]SNT47584.1 propionyl-CoA synthetase [Rhodococcus kyotonensis]